MKRTVVLLIVWTVLTGYILGAENILFKDYKYGMSKNEVKKLTKGDIEEVEDFNGFDLIGENGIVFGGLTWNAAYAFLDNKLDRVILMMDENINQQKAITIMGLLKNSGFSLTGGEYEGGRFDAIEAIRKGKNSEKEYEIFSGGITNEVTFYFADDSIVSKYALKATNHSTLFKNAPKNARELILEINDTEEVIRLSFTLPKLSEQKRLDMLEKAPKESF